MPIEPVSPTAGIRYPPVLAGPKQFVRGLTKTIAQLGPPPELTGDEKQDVAATEAWASGATRDARLDAMSDMLEGAMKTAAPLVVAAALLDLPATALGLGLAWGVATAAGKAAQLAEASPSMTRFVENVAGAATALGGARVVAQRLSAMPAGVKRGGRALALAGRLSGYGPGDIPGASGLPVSMTEMARQTERPPTARTLAVEESIRQGGTPAEKVAAEQGIAIRAGTALPSRPPLPAVPSPSASAGAILGTRAVASRDLTASEEALRQATGVSATQAERNARMQAEQEAEAVARPLLSDLSAMEAARTLERRVRVGASPTGVERRGVEPASLQHLPAGPFTIEKFTPDTPELQTFSTTHAPLPPETPGPITVTAFHGTKGSFDALDVSQAGVSDLGLVGQALYFTPSQEQAQAFADSPHYGRPGGAPRVLAATLTIQRPFFIRDGQLPDGRRLSDLHPQGITTDSGEQLRREIQGLGHDGVVFTVAGTPTQYVVFDPSSVTSRVSDVRAAGDVQPRLPEAGTVYGLAAFDRELADTRRRQGEFAKGRAAAIQRIRGREDPTAARTALGKIDAELKTLKTRERSLKRMIANEQTRRERAEGHAEEPRPALPVVPRVPAERDALIERIVDAARKPEPKIVPIVQLKGTDGGWYRATGFPQGVGSTGEKRIQGYAIRSSQGTTVGQMRESHEAVRSAWQAAEDRNAEEFGQVLRAMPDTGETGSLASQAAYWLKETPLTEGHQQGALKVTGAPSPQTTADTLETGEIQERLPEAGTVREQEVSTPAFEAPFSLAGETETTVREREADLFARDLETLRGVKAETPVYATAPETPGLPLFKPKAEYERRPGTDRATSDALAGGALADLAAGTTAAVSARAPTAHLRSGPTLRGLGITPELVRTGRLDLRGQTITAGAHDIATLAQVVRDPRFETLRVIYVKSAPDGSERVLATEAFSSRLPDAVMGFVSSPAERRFGRAQVARYGDDRARWPMPVVSELIRLAKTSQAKFLEAQRARMERLGASGYYLVHNHPSGHADPSTNDIAFTKATQERRRGLRGHVVIDSGEYAVIDADGTVTKHQIDDRSQLLAASVPHEVIGQSISSPAKVRAIGARLNQPGGVTIIYGAGVPGRKELIVRAVETVPAAMVKGRQFRGFLKNRRAAYGGQSVFLYVERAGEEAALRLYNQHVVRDVVSAATAESASELSGSRQIALLAEAFPGTRRVGEEEPSYERRAVRTILADELQRLADKLGTSVEVQRARAEAAGYTVERPTFIESGREIPVQRRIDPKKLLEFPSLQKMPESIRGDIADLLAQYQGFEAQRRGVQPIPRTQALAKDVWLPLETLKPGTALNAEELNTYQTAVATALTERQSVLEKIKASTATDWDRLQFSHLTDVATILTASFRGAKAESGRALRVLREKARILDLQESKFLQAALRAPGLQSDLIAVSKAALDAAGDPLKQLRVLRRRASGDWFDLFQAYYYTNLLSGLKTHLRNTIGNSFNVLGNTITPLGAAPADVIRARRTGRPRTVYLGEIPQNIVGGFLGLQRGWQNAAFTFREGFRPSAVHAATLGQFDTPRVELPGGAWTNWPGRALEAADEFFRAIAWHQELYAGVYAQARARGATTKEAISEYMAGILAGTTGTQRDVYETVRAKADAFAARAVFQEPPGPIVRWLLKAKAPSAPIQLRATALFISPFIKTPSAILRQGAEWSPAGFVMKGARGRPEDSGGAGGRGGGGGAAGGREQSQALGRAILGSAFILGPLAWLAATGRLTGAPPDNPGDREEFYAQGKLANAVRVGNYWIRYVLFQPFSVPLAAIANAWQMFSESDQNEGAAEDAFVTAIAGAGASILDQSFLSALGTFLDAINEPKRYGGQWLSLFTQGFVPFSGLMRNVVQAVDPVVRQPQGVIESVQAILPGRSSTLLPRRTRFGEPITRPGSWVQRGFLVPEVSKAVEDEVTTTLARLGVQPTTPRATFSIRGAPIPLTREQQDAAIEAMGRERKFIVGRIVGDPQFKQQPDEQQRVVLTRAITRASEGVRSRVLVALSAKAPLAVEQLVSPEVREQMRRETAAVFGEEEPRALAR